MVRKFNERFNSLNASVLAGTIAGNDLKQFYYKALGRGDAYLMQHALWSTPEYATLNELQDAVSSKLDGFAVLAGDGLALGS